MTAQQDIPCRHRLRMAGGFAGAPVDDARALGCAAEDIGAGIDRMPQDLQHRVVGRRPPLDLAHAAIIAPGDRQLQRLILRPKQDLPSAPELLELVEQETDDPADALVGIHLDLADLVPAIAGREDEPQLAPQRLRIPRRNSALAQKAQLVLGHRPLQPQEKAIIDQARIVRAVRIDHQRADKGAQIDQVVPVAAVPREAGRLDAKHGTDRTRADRGHQFLETRALHQSGTGAAEIVVDYRDRGESKRSRRLGQRILPTLALGVLRDLPHGRLAHIDHRAAAEVFRRDLGMHHTPPARPVSPCFVCRALREADRPAPAAAPPAPAAAGGVFRRERDRAPVDCGSDVSSEPSFAVEEVNDPSEVRSAERVSRTARSSVSASIAILGLPNVIAAQTAASHIHAGISRDSPSRTSM
jgi:hypothetical protein